MRINKIKLIILAFLSITACNNTPKSNTTAVEIPKTEQKSEPVKEMTKATLDLTKYGIANNQNNVLGGLKVGDKAPDFKMMDQDGKSVNLEEIIEHGPVLMVFLRAEWCSYCVRHLKEFQDNLQDLHDAGNVKVVAVSPQQTSYMQKFHKENQFAYPILYDEDHSVMKDYKVFFHVTDRYNDYIEKAKGERIEVFNGDTEPVMPVPATYLIGQDKTIKYVHYDPNYKKRSDINEVIAQL